MLLQERKTAKGPNATWRERLAATSGLAVLMTSRTEEEPLRGHSGGDTREAHARHVADLRSLLEGMAARNEPLPAQRRHPDATCYQTIADLIGARVESFRNGSELRAMVDTAAEALGVAPAIREGTGEILLGEVLGAAVTALRRERQIEGAPAIDEVNALKQTAWLAARTSDGDMSLPAASALNTLRSNIEAGRIKLTRMQASALARIETWHCKLLDGGGLPEGFAEAVTVLTAKIGLSLQQVAAMIGMNSQTLTNWAAGTRSPDPGKLHFVTKLEELYGVSTGELANRVRSNRKGRARFPQKLYPEHLRGVGQARRRSRLSPLLPQNFETLDEMARYAAVALAEAQADDEDVERKKRGSLLVKEMRYGLREFPDGFGADFAAMAAFRESVAGSGKLTGKRWTGKTADIWKTRFLQFCGYISSDHAGPHKVALDDLDFTVFMDPAKIDAFIGFKLKRAETAGKDGKLSEVDVEHYAFAGAMFGKSGWLRQSAEFRRKTGLPTADWESKCRDLKEAYRELASDRRKNQRKAAHDQVGSRDQGYGGALAVLKLQCPMDGLDRLITSMQAEFDVMSDQNPKKASSSQDLVWTMFQAQLALRPFTWSNLRYRADNRGHLRKDADGWYVDIPREFFKNRDSRALDEGFCHRIRDVGGLYAALDRYLTADRFAIVRGMKTDLLFVYGRMGLDENGTALPNFRPNYRPYEAALACSVRRFVARHIGHEADPAKRIEGLRTFSPCAFRHILATAIVKATGRCDLAADAIGDTPEIASKYYQRFLPSDRKEGLEAARDIVLAARQKTVAAEAVGPKAKRREGVRHRGGDLRPIGTARPTRKKASMRQRST